MPSTGSWPAVSGVPFWQPLDFARLCNLLDVRVIDFYNRGFAVIFLPFGVFSLGTLAVGLAQLCAATGRSGSRTTRRRAGRQGKPKIPFAVVRRHSTRGFGQSDAFLVRPVGRLHWLPALRVRRNLVCGLGLNTPQRIVRRRSGRVVFGNRRGLVIRRQRTCPGQAAAAGRRRRHRRRFAPRGGSRPVENLGDNRRFGGSRVSLRSAPTVSLRDPQSAVCRSCSLKFRGTASNFESRLFFNAPKQIGALWLPAGERRSTMVAGLLARLLRWVWILAVVRMRKEGIRTLGGLLNALRERRLLDLSFCSSRRWSGSFLDC